jgi:hypothetical protein
MQSGGAPGADVFVIPANQVIKRQGNFFIDRVAVCRNTSGVFCFYDPLPFLAPGLIVSSNQASSPLDAQAEALLADIASFDLEAARRRVEAVDGRHTGLRGSRTSFPSVSGLPEVQAHAPAPASPAAASQPQAPRPEAAARAPEAQAAPSLLGGGLLAQLRKETEQRQQTQASAAEQLAARRKRCSDVLRQVADYLRELTRQLNVLQPEIPRTYYLFDKHDAFSNLAWARGGADHRSASEGEGGHIMQAGLAYTLKGGGQRQVDQFDPASAERVRKVLIDLGFKLDVQIQRNELNQVTRIRFAFAEEIPVQVVWRADPDQDQILIEARNLERFGISRFSLPLDAVNGQLLDEFGCLVLGRESNFRAKAKIVVA